MTRIDRRKMMGVVIVAVLIAGRVPADCGAGSRYCPG